MVLSEFLEKVKTFFEAQNIPYLVTGSVASIAYGEPRLTNDIDIVAGIQRRHVAALVAAFPPGEFYVDEEAVVEALRNRGQFNIIHPASGLKVDVIVRQNTPFDDSRFARSRRISTAPSLEAEFASPEDVMIKKMEYYKKGGSEKHLRDITGILRVAGDTVDREYIATWVQRLGLKDVWAAIQARMEKIV